ncbi:hypothetical protein TDB9533_02985 [Thalassocella blandensis]|nr:hypothetical protein TDB9533_02985 [Thalassocella blandensis]
MNFLKLNKSSIRHYVSRGALCCALGMVGPAAIDVFSTSAGLNVNVAKAHAQSEAQAAKTRRLPGISERMLKQLGEVQELIAPNTDENPNAQPDFPAALKLLQKMERDCRDKCNSVEQSSIFRFYGYTYVTMERYKEAISYYKKLVALSPGVTIAVELEALFILAQLSYQEENFDDALTFLDRWMALSTIVGSDKIFLKGSIYYAKGDMRNALKFTSQAIKMEEDKGKIANEQWYALQAALMLEKEDYKSALVPMEKLVRNYPKIDYWTRLAGVYGLLNRSKDQMHALDAINVMDGLSKSQDFVNLAYLYLENEVPYKAAKVLEKGFKKKAVDRTVKNLKVLAVAYISSRETQDAIKVLNDTADVAAREDSAKKNEKGYKPEEGNIYTQLTGLYLDVDDSKAAINAGKKALGAGKLDNVGEVHTNMGIAYVDLEKFEEAIKSFESAMKDKRYARFASNWLEHAKRELQRQKELARAWNRVNS